VCAASNGPTVLYTLLPSRVLPPSALIFFRRVVRSWPSCDFRYGYCVPIGPQSPSLATTLSVGDRQICSSPWEPWTPRTFFSRHGILSGFQYCRPEAGLRELIKRPSRPNPGFRLLPRRLIGFFQFQIPDYPSRLDSPIPGFPVLEGSRLPSPLSGAVLARPWTDHAPEGYLLDVTLHFP